MPHFSDVSRLPSISFVVHLLPRPPSSLPCSLAAPLHVFLAIPLLPCLYHPPPTSVQMSSAVAFVQHLLLPAAHRRHTQSERHYRDHPDENFEFAMFTVSPGLGTAEWSVDSRVLDSVLRGLVVMSAGMGRLIEARQVHVRAERQVLASGLGGPYICPGRAAEEETDASRWTVAGLECHLQIACCRATGEWRRKSDTVTDSMSIPWTMRDGKSRISLNKAAGKSHQREVRLEGRRVEEVRSTRWCLRICRGAQRLMWNA